MDRATPHLAEAPPDEPDAVAQASTQLALAHQRIQDDHGDALDAAAQALQAATAAGSAALQAEAHACVAQAHFHLGTLDEAFKHILQAMQRFHALADVAGEARAHASHAQYLQELGQEKEALDEALLALRLADSTTCPVARANALMAVGFAYRSIGQPAEARGFFDRAARVARAGGQDLLRGRALCNVANTWGDLGFELEGAGETAAAHKLYRRGFRLYQRLLPLFRQLRNRRLESVVQGNMGLSLGDQGRYDEAIALLQDLLQRAIASDSAQTQEMAHRFIGETCLRARRFDEAIAALLASDRIATESQRHESAVHANRALADAYEQAGDTASALRHHRRYHELYAKVQSDAAQRRARAVAVQMETEKAKAAAEAQRLRAERLEHANRQLQQEADELEQASLQDPLTGLLNRRGLDALLSQELSRRADQPYCIALLDLDHFKRINDRFSHLVGDGVLRALGNILRSCCRQNDVASRFGGEEFAIVFRHADASEAAAACERMRLAIERYAWHGLHPELAVTASFGVAESTQAQGEALFALADQRLYEAKREGRNRVVAG